jgi:hypothetical protein
MSELVSSRLPFTPDDVLQIFDKFIEMGSQILLHLKFLREVTLYVWNAGQTAPEEVYSVGLDKSAMKEEEMQKRSSLFLHLASKLEACKGNIKELAASKENIFETMLNQTPAKDFPQDIYNVRCIVKGRRRRRPAVADTGALSESCALLPLPLPFNAFGSRLFCCRSCRIRATITTYRRMGSF